MIVNSVNSLSSLGARKKSDMMVLLEREDGKYTAGERVRGRVHIILTQDINIKGQHYHRSYMCVHRLYSIPTLHH